MTTRERLRILEQDHEPDGWPAVQMRDITEILDELDGGATERNQMTNDSQAESGGVVSSTALLACPFCGGQWIPEHPKMHGLMPYTSAPKLEELTAGGWRVTCYGCGVGTWDSLKYTKKQAVAAWNTRRQDNTELLDELESCRDEQRRLLSVIGESDVDSRG